MPVALEPIQTEQYPALLEAKTAHIQACFDELDDFTAGMPLEVYSSKPKNYRMRAEFRLWHENDDLFYAMFAVGNKRDPIRIECFPQASESINALMQPLLDGVKASTVLRHKLFQMDFLSSQRGEILVSLLYHKQLGDDWLAEAEHLRQQLGINIIGRARKQKHVLGQGYIMETLQIGGQQFHYQQVENAFTQPNASVNEQMIAWACESVARYPQLTKPDLLELYCGNGNFTLPLAGQFRKVMATEIAKSSVNSAHFNLTENNIDNVTIVRLSSEEMTQALAGVRPFRRLADVDLSSFDFGTILVDPPRAGLDPDTLALVQQFDQVIYISCNPETLLDNLQHLKQTHDLKRLALFDQFPYTHHAECGVVLHKHNKKAAS
ncbi:MAG: tRNA (uridine(54)-C5)-methyltransferase TrmA [Oceanospirillaceae bacterium]|jgi:tRNA (uracil-5-)-methyltransferase|nr:tRNA (uridine(54)-C5)-methyltransferase TrmA [Oceanospirillaceae bacterium]MBT4442050.1 tRNA (uridine(54)-C5)-methyltransferase TrmA [Oceanospirillaceae bacterium]